MSRIRLGNVVRYDGRLWIASGRSHRSDGVYLLLVEQGDCPGTARVRPDEVEDLGDFSQPVPHGGYTPAPGSEPAHGNRAAGEA